MSPGKLITLVGVSVILMYIFIQILNFYGVTADSYAKYIVFYVFLLGYYANCIFVYFR